MNTENTLSHQQVLRKLVTLLDVYVRGGFLGEILLGPIQIRLDESTLAQPDVSLFLPETRLHQEGNPAILNTRPDVIIEILDVSTAYRDLVESKRIYARKGIGEYWIVDPKGKSVEIFENIDGHFTTYAMVEDSESITSRLVPAIEVALAELFPN